MSTRKKRPRTPAKSRLQLVEAMWYLGMGYRRFRRLLDAGEITYYEMQGSTPSRRLLEFDRRDLDALAKRLRRGRRTPRRTTA